MTIKFNAGKVEYDEETKKCTPLPHKGTVTIAPSAEEEGFLDFVWAPNSATVEKDELLIMPGDMTFKPVKSCKTGRVVALTFLGSGDKSLYWLQDVGDDDVLDQWTAKDRELVAAVQAVLTEPEAKDEPEAEEEKEQTREVEAAGTATVDNEAAGTQRSGSGAGEGIGLGVSSLGDVLTPAAVAKHLENVPDDVLASTYGSLLPAGVAPTRANIVDVVRSEFFRKAAAELSSNVAENNVGHILSSSFGYEYTGEGLEAFLAGLRKASKKDSP